MTFSYGSVCSGIEAATAAWELFGARPAWFAEIERFPAAVLAHHYPSVPNLGDMTLIAGYVRQGLVYAPGVLVGGTPCQAFSVAGLRAGLADPRGQLTLSYVDLANAIDEQRPGDECVVVWENVPGVLSDKSNAFGCFLGCLAGEDDALVPPGKSWPNAGVVYGPQRAIAWRVLDAQYFGVAQRRRRVFVVASARKGFDPTEVLFERDGVRRDSPPSRESGEEVTGTISSRTTGGGGLGPDFECAGGLQPVGRGDSGGTGTAGLIAGGQLARCLTTRTRIDAETETPSPTIGGVFSFDAIAGTLQANGKAAGSATQQDAESGMLVPLAFDCKASGMSGFGVGEITSTMRAMGHSSSHQNGGGHLAVCITGDITHTLKAEGFDASEDGTGRGQPIVAFQSSQSGVRIGDTHATLDANNGPRRHNGALVGMAVRRLTPRECERLQAFPDDYTLIPGPLKHIAPDKLDLDYMKYLMRGGVLTFEQCMNAAADGPRYKALGNSMCVNVMRWIGARIVVDGSVSID